MGTNMDPVPLRALTVLLNRERMLSDPRFKNMGLVKSSVADPALVSCIKTNNPRMFAGQPSTVEEIQFHLFQELTESSAEEDTKCVVHPDADDKVRCLESDQLERIYSETRGHNGCYKAIGLYDFFFEFCPKGQQVSIQIANEKPLLVDASSRMVLEMKINGPKRLITGCILPVRQLHTGMLDGENHIVLAFKHPEKPGELLIVDMTRMQYGVTGRGSYGEGYFMGTWDTYSQSMKQICRQVEVVGFVKFGLGEDKANEARCRGCSETVWRRWQNRGTEGWCDYCGKGGSGLLMCGRCKKVHYCSAKHQKLGWKLHKLTCGQPQEDPNSSCST